MELLRNGRLKTRLLFILMLILLYGWIYQFESDDLIRSIGVTIFAIIIGINSMRHVYKAYKLDIEGLRKFWLLLNIGIAFFILFESLWFFQTVLFQNPVYLDVINFVWDIYLIFYLSAIIYKIKVISHYPTLNNPFIFNIIIFMTTAFTISIQYLVKPILDVTNESIMATVLVIIYPILSLSSIIATGILYYIARFLTKRIELISLTILFSAIVMFIADFGFMYHLSIEIFPLASIWDPLWIISIWLLGLAGKKGQMSCNYQKGSDDKLSNLYTSPYPYFSILLLVFLTIHQFHYKVNALFIGLCMTILLVIFRQVLLLRHNKQIMKKYKYLAYHDPLTGLLNRTSFKIRLKAEIDEAKASNSKLAVILLDLDRFKNINDTLGHHVGDSLLKEVSNRLVLGLNVGEVCFRIGGDEFVIILTETSDEQAKKFAEKLMTQFSSAFQVDDYSINVSPSVGISMYPDNGISHDTLFKYADAAMYLAKERGNNTYQFFNGTLHEKIERKILLENGLRNAIQNQELHVVYHPKVILATREIFGMEALLRWKHPVLGYISPAEFIPIAEETGQIIPIGEWMLRKACEQAKQWEDSGFPPLYVAVNVSVRQFQQKDFVEKVTNIIHETGMNPNYLELEITESIIQDIDESINVLKGLQELGISPSIDDFGTGYSSLYILKELPIDIIKIDKSFIDYITEKKDKQMVKTIIELGLSLDLRVVAEGIETEEQLAKLIEYDCKFGQGYLFAKPLDAVQFEQLLLSKINDNI
ncbi:putative bifunctional diguanylate cyclase/phosphodiesterase [Metabacillus malikii]|uniref:Diguanylate cyclase (GGDEF)-like protein n=1 Tax=Metabacillus malikii TaxID=1504265 RepID=A0ABT9ZII3_9BACI|nr:EAL domain-containing protein [Metabacillus malikii]MDQ0231709.1 diguanylate cyclase (GGDEF)-like protein [Metabacillus malikii]